MIDWLRGKHRSPQPQSDLQEIEIAGRMVPLAIRRTANARRMTMRLAPDGAGIRITLPRWGSQAEALAFARSRADWLATQLATQPVPLVIGHGALLPFAGRQLELCHDPASTRRVQRDGDRLIVGGAAESLAPRLSRWLKGEARPLLNSDLAEYCQRAGQPVPRLLLSNARRRWGSCAGDGTIRINWRLVMAPDWVRRSVVAHEVAHLVHFDHSPAFHALLDAIYEGDIARANGWLKREGRQLYAPLG